MAKRTDRKKRVLLVDDDESLRVALGHFLECQGYPVTCAATTEEMFDILGCEDVDVLLLDLFVGEDDSLRHLPRLRSDHASLQTIMITGSGTLDTAVEALRQGVYDFVTKPVDTKRLLHSIHGALKLARQARGVGMAPANRRPGRTDEPLLGAVAGMSRLRDMIAKVSTSSCAVLVVGESGTGKELVARAIHGESDRRDQAMKVVNCGALPAELVESELFGHEKGAFTGATGAKAGFVELADKATLFLDEIGEMPIELQTKLLRFLEDKTFHRVGGTRELKVDARVVCATNRDPLELMQRGALREDLFYRISQVTLRVPSLRERKNDVPILARHFLQRAASEEGKGFEDFEPDALALLQDYHWPGNVRHLLNVVTEIVVLHDGDIVTHEMLPYDIVQSVKDRQSTSAPINGTPSRTGPGGVRPIWQLEKEAIRNALVSTRGSVAEASALLEISQATLYRKIKRYAINLPPPCAVPGGP